MSLYEPENQILRASLVFCFHLKKSASEAHSLLVEAFGDHALSKSRCYAWYENFSKGNFDLKNEPRGRPPKKFQDQDLQVLLDQNNTQTQSELAEQLKVTREAISIRLKKMGKISKLGRWVPHELSERQKEVRLTVCRELLSRYKNKSFLYRIITSDEKWIYYDNPGRKRSWVSPGEPAEKSVRRNRFGKKTMLCVWWDQRGVIYHELLKPGETVDTARYQQQLIDLNRAVKEKRPNWDQVRNRVILLHDNAPCHTSKPTQETLSALNWEVLTHPAYSPDLAPSDYYLFASMSHALNNQRFTDFEEVEKWVVGWFDSKNEAFYHKGIHNLPERWSKCISNQGAYFE